jgi:hypothetical protein
MNDQPKPPLASPAETEAPAPKVIQPVESSTKASLLGGAPLATLTVYLWEQFYLVPHHQHFDATTAVAIGTVGAAVFGEAWLIVSRLINRLLQKLGA